MHDAEMSNTQSLTLGRSPRHRTVDASARYATAPRHSSADSRISPYRWGENGSAAQNVRSAGRSPRSKPLICNFISGPSDVPVLFCTLSASTSSSVGVICCLSSVVCCRL